VKEHRLFDGEGVEVVSSVKKEEKQEERKEEVIDYSEYDNYLLIKK
jgi:hypothetical protein